MTWLSWLPRVFITQAELDEAKEDAARLTISMNAMAEGDMKIMQELNNELLEVARDRDRALQGVNHASNLHVKACKERDEARSQLSALRQKHSVLIHLVNDAAMEANGFDESTDCGVVNGRPTLGGD